MMPGPTVGSNVYKSPKRKRDAPNPFRYSPSLSPSTPRLNTDLPTHPIPEDEVAVTGEEVKDGGGWSIQNLNLRSTGIKLDFGKRDDGEAARKRFQLMDDEYEGWEDLEIRGPCMKA
jgi:hypothetical protein